MRRGVFITFEGPEGGGKSTHLKAAAGRLREAGVEVVATREPGGTPVGEAIRGLLQHDAGGEAPAARAEALLFYASRAQLVERVITPALARGAWVLCDRFADSTLAYQGYGRGFSLDDLAAANRFATGGLQPDLTLLLDLPVDVGMARMAQRNARLAVAPDRFEREQRAFHDRLRHGFLSLAAAEPERFRVVPSERPADAVQADVWAAIAAAFGDRLKGG